MGNASNLLVPGATSRDLLAAMFDLNELECYVYLCLLGQSEHTLDDLSAHLERDRTTIHRAVNKLVSLGIVVKENRGLEGGGYYQAYKPAPPEMVSRAIEQRFEAIKIRVDHLVKTFSQDVKHLAAEAGAKIHAKR